MTNATRVIPKGAAASVKPGIDVRVFEVGPRDGFQNEPLPVTLPAKLDFVRDLIEAGIRDVELGAWVRFDRVPKMADTPAVYRAVRSGKLELGRARAWSLVPNLKGLELARAAGVKNIAVFTAATSKFTERNIGMSVERSLDVYREVITEATRLGIRVRGYVSTAFGCPFEGRVAPRRALDVIEKLASFGVEQVSIGDTIGVATPDQVDSVVVPAMRAIGGDKVAVHFHDTRGTALANTLRSLEVGIRTVDASAGGLGGCPFAPSATGNLATEDLIYMLDGMGVKTGIDLTAVCQASLRLARRMRRPLTGRYLQAFAARK